MISLDQIQMLERKVESAVAKIAALQELNTALRDKNTELEHSNTVLLQRISTFESDQSRIEQGILNALDRLNSMESAVLKTTAAASSPVSNSAQTQTSPDTARQPLIHPVEQAPVQNTAAEAQDPLLTDLDNEPSDEISLDFDSEEENTSAANPQFDIF